MNDTSQLHILEENTLSKKGNFTEAETIRAVKKQSLFVPDVHDLTDVPSKSNVEIYDDFSARIRVLSAAVNDLLPIGFAHAFAVTLNSTIYKLLY